MTIGLSTLFLLIIFSSPSVALDDHDDALDEYFRGLLEGLRVIMGIGFADFGLPVLEPYSVEEQEINFNNSNTRVHLVLQNFTLKGLSTFQVPFLRISLPNFRFRLTLRIPEIYATGWYQLNGTGFYVVPLKGHGQLEVRIINLTISVGLQLVQKEDRVTMQLLTLSGDMERFDSHLDNLLSDGNLSLVLNNIIRTHSRTFMGRVIKQIRPTIESNLDLVSEIIDTTIFEDYGPNRQTVKPKT